jgi:enoyl-[acyl-carrier protein] reductase I
MTPLVDRAGKGDMTVGTANVHSIAYGCARTVHDAEAELAVTYVNAKAAPYTRPLAEPLDAPIIMPCDVPEHGQLEAVF